MNVITFFLHLYTFSRDKVFITLLKKHIIFRLSTGKYNNVKIVADEVIN